MMALQVVYRKKSCNETLSGPKLGRKAKAKKKQGHEAR
jgi:hypothetical protein